MVPFGTGGENSWIEADYEGVLRSADLTLSWEATTPATGEMYLYLLGVRSCGDNCFETDDTTYRASASGSSPVTLSAADITLTEGETLWIHVGVVRPTPSVPAPFFYSLEQPFSIDGVLVAMVNATA
jgi:hypothetical protein